MGIPKFFRYIAQRWPLSSQLVNDNVIPEFDNMYLDMNSIVHMCTHANAENIGHLDEDLVFENIGNYIEHLFTVVSPKKVFFMAIDGVAPRAKMNQQRSRRFRSAKDAEDQRRENAAKGLEIDEDPFDSNCITPGTVFMANLTRFLKFFIARKISEDSKWQDCRIVLSGHEVPGEGEHKIMSFIRHVRSQEDYDVNTRHCLYGLDADLIMLGLSTHEPHFSLLREEVTFGRSIQFQSQELSEKRFNLLHLSLVREYIEMELNSGDNWGDQRPDFERQLDDFILIMFLIGNDFLPELPMLMINDGAIPVIFDTYKEYLRSSNNKYLSLNGQVDFLALKGWLGFLKRYQVEKFEEQANVANWYRKQHEDTTSVSGQQEVVLTQSQRDVLDYVLKFMRRALKHEDHDSELEVSDEPQFLTLLAQQTGFEYSDGKLKLAANSDVTTKEALHVLRIYDAFPVNNPHAKAEYEEKFTEWKNAYYLKKFGDTADSEKIKKVSLRYLEGLQWVLYYYYRSCQSWSWYFDDHYAPMTTELISAIGDGFEPEFQLGEPFRPFEQLMSVLPDRSVQLLPPALHHLVLEPTSPIIDFYPHTFELDRNGKKQDWMSVVLIPFIDEQRLLKYVRPIEDNELTDAEKFRNSRGVELEFYHDPSQITFYESPSRRLPSLDACSCVSRQLSFPRAEIRYGRLEGSYSGSHLRAGFPSLTTLPFSWSLKSDTGVKIFEMPSRDPSIVLSIEAAAEKIKVGQRLFIGWPFLREAKVTSIRAPDETFVWSKLLPQLTEEYCKVGVQIGKTEAQVGVVELQGLKRDSDGSYVKDFDGPEVFVPAQLVVHSVENEDPRFTEREIAKVEDEFPTGSNVLLLLAKYFGAPATIKDHGKNTVDVEAIVPRYRDPVFPIAHAIARADETQQQWFSVDQVARSAEIPVRFLLNLTSFLPIEIEKRRVNVALKLRDQRLNLVADGYLRMGYRRMYEFSDRGVALIVSYLSRFRSPLTQLMKGAKTVDSNTAKEMRDWITKHTEKVSLIPFTTTHLRGQSVQALEQKVQSLPPMHLEKVLIRGVERGALLAPAEAPHQLRFQGFKLGDRVVSALDHGKVPLFSRGIVVGINGAQTAHATLDVLWDHEFGAASYLDGKAKTKRGLTVSASSVLNLTKPQLEYLHGRAPIVTKISAKVDTRATAAQVQQKKEAKNPKYVPAPAGRNDWQAAKLAKLSLQQQPQQHQQPKASQPPQPPQPHQVSQPQAPQPQVPQPQQPQPQQPQQYAASLEQSQASPQETPKIPKAPKSDRSSRPPKNNRSTKEGHEKPRGQRKGNQSKPEHQDQQKHQQKHPQKQKPSEPQQQQQQQQDTPVRGSGPAKPETVGLPDLHSTRPRDPEATKRLLSTLFNKSE